MKKKLLYVAYFYAAVELAALTYRLGKVVRQHYEMKQRYRKEIEAIEYAEARLIDDIKSGARKYHSNEEIKTDFQFYRMSYFEDQ